jgi:uncharacterized protein (DUF2225 family)
MEKITRYVAQKINLLKFPNINWLQTNLQNKENESEYLAGVNKIHFETPAFKFDFFVSCEPDKSRLRKHHGTKA